MKIRLLNAALVRELLPLDRCIPLMRAALSLVTHGKTLQPLRVGVRPPGIHGLLGLMPGYIETPQWLGAKVLTIFENGFGDQLGSHQGMVLLFEAERGTPKAIIDAAELTALRTAAASAVATDVLARTEAVTLGVFGYGEQARRHVQAISLVRKLRRVLVWGRNPDKARTFAAERAAQFDLAVEAVTDIRAAAEADILCTTTSASTPFLHGDWLRPGQHVNLVGASLPTAAETDGETVRRSRYFGDYVEGTRAQAGEWRLAREGALVSDDHLLGCIGDVLEGRVPGRVSASDITVFKSLGMIAEDLVSAAYVLQQAEHRNGGIVVDW